jgi:hypothetical protein
MAWIWCGHNTTSKLHLFRHTQYNGGTNTTASTTSTEPPPFLLLDNNMTTNNYPPPQGGGGEEQNPPPQEEHPKKEEENEVIDYATILTVSNLQQGIQKTKFVGFLGKTMRKNGACKTNNTMGNTPIIVRCDIKENCKRNYGI